MKLRSSWSAVASTMRSIRGRGKLSFGLADVSEIDTESPFAIRFFDEYDVGQSFRVFHFSDRTCLEELVDLLINRFLSFWGETSSFFA